MSEMVERVARVIDEMCAGADPRDHAAFAEAARAAIAAMREPTFDPETVSYHQGMTRADWWRAMIDEALK
jgi:hypothetical protein